LEEEINMSAFQLKERRARTLFVGNVPLDTGAEELKKLFKEHGKVEKIWFRSHALDPNEKQPAKARIILRQFSGQTKSSKNAYILYSEKEETEKAAKEMANMKLGERHLSVDTDNQEGRKHDFETTLFVGNLPWVVDEEEIRDFFQEAGEVLNVRVIRDPNTQIGKGFCYVQMKTKQDLKVALETRQTEKFKNRYLRVKKATPVERREKKQKKRDAKIEDKKAVNKQIEEIKPREKKVYDSDAEDENELIQEMRGKAGLDEASMRFVKQTASSLQHGYGEVSVIG
jgi:nucleolar protein 12